MLAVHNLSLHLKLNFIIRFSFSFLAFQIGAIYLWVYAYNVVRMSVEASLRTTQKNRFPVGNSSVALSMPEPICSSEPLLSQTDAITSEQNAETLPLARFERKPQVAYCLRSLC